MIRRYLHEIIKSKIGDGKIIVILGARQVGKTTLLKDFFPNNDGVLWLNGDYEETRAMMSSESPQVLGSIIGDKKIVVWQRDSDNRNWQFVIRFSQQN